jgi:hypothetical protein
MGLAAHVDHFLSDLGMVIGIAALGLTVCLLLAVAGPFARRLGPIGRHQSHFRISDPGDCGAAGLEWSDGFSRLSSR